LAVAAEKSLQTCRRIQTGLPILQPYQAMEVKLADEIRWQVVTLVAQNEQPIQALCTDMPFLLDRGARDTYSSVTSRCEAMKTTTEYAGFIDIVTACYILDIQVSLYTQMKHNAGLSLLARFPSSETDRNKAHVHLLHRLDTSNTAGHFDLLLPNADLRDTATVAVPSIGLYTESSGFIAYLQSAAAGDLRHSVCTRSTSSDTVVSAFSDESQIPLEHQQLEPAAVFNSSSSNNGDHEHSDREAEPDCEAASNILVTTELSSSDDIRLFPNQPRTGNFPYRMIGNVRRSFQRCWFDSYSWLEWEPTVDAAFCHRCRMASSLGLLAVSHRHEDAFTRTGFSNWKRALDRFREHEKSSCHREAVVKWAGYMNSRTIADKICATAGEQQQQRRHVLLQLFDSLRYLARQGLATRGHNDFTSNYHQLLNLRAKESQQLAEWLTSDRHNKWLSHEVESEMLERMSHALLRKLTEDIRGHEYFALIADETTDISRIEQLSLCIRHVDASFEIHDDFVGMYAIPRTDAVTITSVIKDSMCRLNLSLANMRAQCYDGASNMAGVHSGVQRRIRDEQKKAVYVHCANHSLNLALQEASLRVHCIRDALSFTNDLATFFRDSAKRTAIMEAVLADMNQNAKSRLLPLCPTRWTVRTRALKAVLTNYLAVMESLDQMSDAAGPAGSKAQGLMDKMKTFECFFGISISYEVFSVTEQLATALQSKVMTLTGARTSALAVVSTLKQLRSEESFSSVWNKVCQTASEHQLSLPVMPRKRRLPRRLDDGQAPYEHQDCAARHRVETWYAFLDIVLHEIDERFSDECFKTAADIETVLLRAANGLPITSELQAVTKLYDDLNCDTLAAQLAIFKSLFTASTPSTVHDIVAAVKSTAGASLLLSEIVRLLKLLLVIPATSASAERSFSSLRRLKTYLRSTIGQSRLNHLLLLHCHQDRLDQLDLHGPAQEFISANDQRAKFFGNF
jgi:Domain of unknown function (DUF4371)/hAT family C-terminal dimerisation region